MRSGDESGGELELFGRDAESVAVGQLLEHARGGPAGLSLVGDAGIGKTSLLRAGVAQARSSGFRVLFARPGRFERELTFAALGDLLDPVFDEVCDLLPEPQRDALAVALLRASGGVQLDQRAVSVAVLGALQVLASSPVLVVMDDVQWLDPPSARALEFALRRLRSEPVGVLASARERELSEDDFRLERVLGSAEVRGVEPLSLAEVDRVLRTRLGAALSRPTVAELHRVSGGNPFFALELGRAFIDQGRSRSAGEPLPVPDSLRDLLRARLDRLSLAACEVLFVASALSQPTTAVMERVLDDAAAREGLAAAVAADILVLDGERVRFDHPLLASAVYGETPEGRRRELHRQLASVVDDPQERARHLALGTPVPDAAVAASIDTAARAAAARGAHAVAAVLAERAHALTPASGVAAGAGRLVRAADYQLRAGDPVRARGLLVRAVDLAPEGPLRARGYHRLAVVDYLAEGLGAAEENLVAAAREVGTDRALGAAIERDLAVTLMQGRSVTLARPHSRRALELAEGQSDEGLLADTLVVAAMVELLAGSGLRRDFLDRAAGLESAGPARHPGVFDRAFLHATVLKWADDFNAARSRFEGLRNAALARAEEGLLPGIDFQLGELECWAGNLDAAARYAREGLVAAEQYGLTAMLALALNLTALVQAGIGDLDAARAAAQDALERCEHSGDLRHLMRSLKVLGFIKLLEGDASGACGDLGRVARLAGEAGYGDPGVLRFEADEIEALAQVGELDQAQRRLDQLHQRAGAVDRASALAVAERSRGFLFAARGDTAGARHAFEAALVHHASTHQPIEEARTLLALGNVERRRRQKRSAREALQRAADIFDAAGARGWAARARADLGRVGGRPAAPGELTASERRICELISEGCTNREIAGQLFLSPKTVEAHVSRIFAKVGIRSRRELRSSPRWSKPEGADD